MLLGGLLWNDTQSIYVDLWAPWDTRLAVTAQVGRALSDLPLF